MVLRATIIKSLDLNREWEKDKKINRRNTSKNQITLNSMFYRNYNRHTRYYHVKHTRLLKVFNRDSIIDIGFIWHNTDIYRIFFLLPNLSKWNTNAQSVNEIIKMFNLKRYIWTRSRKKCVYLSFILSSSVLCFLHSFVILYLNLSIVANLSRCYLDSVQLLRKLEQHKQFSI